MGHRTLKRVPMDFAAPLNKVWEGYINPYPGPLTCNLCNGDGSNAATRQIADEFYDLEGFGSRWRYDYYVAPDGSPATAPPWRIVGECRAWKSAITQDEVQALVDAGRLWGFTRVPLNDEQREVVRKKVAEGGNSWLPYDNGRIPTADEVNEWNERGSGHDGINRSILVEARAKRLGVFGKCPACNGEGTFPHPDEAIRKLHEEWKEYEPPTGAGYQLWETCSEGSPTSPVFASAEELADWCAENATVFADEKTSRENWLRMFTDMDGLEVGSTMISRAGYTGSLVNETEEETELME